MRLIGMRITVGGILVVVAAVAMCLAAFRLHLSLGSFTTGVLALTFLRTFEVSKQCRQQGTPLARGPKASLILWSLAIATMILTGSLVIAVFVFEFGGDYSSIVCPPARSQYWPSSAVPLPAAGRVPC